MEATSFATRACPLARAVEQVGPWWNLLILRNVFLGMRRFQDLQRNLEVTPTTLNRRLRQLCGDGILERHQYQQHPPRHEYALTPKGIDLLPVVITLTSWGQQWLAPEGAAIQAVDHRSGEPIVPKLVDARTGRLVEPGMIRVLAGPAADAPLKELLRNAPLLPSVEESRAQPQCDTLTDKSASRQGPSPPRACGAPHSSGRGPHNKTRSQQ